MRAARAKYIRSRVYKWQESGFSLSMSKTYLESDQLGFQVLQNLRRVTFGWSRGIERPMKGT